MIAHVVLFRPKATLDREAQFGLADAFTRAVEGIPGVRRAQVGRRIMTGRPYEQMMFENYTHAAVIEFSDRAALQAYLKHPSHQDLATHFFGSFEAALIYDYEMGADAAALL